MSLGRPENTSHVGRGYAVGNARVGKCDRARNVDGRRYEQDAGAAAPYNFVRFGSVKSVGRTRSGTRARCSVLEDTGCGGNRRWNWSDTRCIVSMQILRRFSWDVAEVDRGRVYPRYRSIRSPVILFKTVLATKNVRPK